MYKEEINDGYPFMLDFFIQFPDEECKEYFKSGDFMKVVDKLSGNVFNFQVSNGTQILQLPEQNDSNYQANALLIGASCLYHFIRNNFLGPEIDTLGEHEVLQRMFHCEDTDEIENQIIRQLCPDQDEIFNCSKSRVFLLLAGSIFSSLPDSLANKWWLMRYLYIYQLSLADPSPRIHKDIFLVMERIEDYLKPTMAAQNLKAASKKETHVLIMFYMEQIQIHLQLYSNVIEAKKLVDKVTNLLHLNDVKLDGKLGKRTKYQQRDIAQLTLSVHISNQDEINSLLDETYHCDKLPKDQRLDDDVRLPFIKFSDDTESSNQELNVIQQAAVLAIYMLSKKSGPKDEILTEQLLAYSNYLLKNPKSWNIQNTMLLHRSVIEAESSRTVERSISQIQSIITDWENCDPPITDRLPLVFCSYITSKRDLQHHLAQLLLKVGLVKSALDIYIHLDMWEDVIACYNYLKMKEKAAEVISKKLQEKETVYLLCLLGDATDDVNCYEKAWKLSCEKSARAQKHWGLYYFQRKQYAESISHLEKSLEINSLQIPIWFNLGFAAMTQENWILCAKAFRRYCSLEPDNFQAWNNLAKAYIKMGQKNRAFGALQEAVKCNYDNWMVWDNLLAVSADCADFKEVIRCYHRILEIKGKHVDVEILQILTDVIKSGNYLSEIEFKQLKINTHKLFGRITSMVLNNADIWRLYAEVLECNDCEFSNQDKVVQYLTKAYRAAYQEPNWDINIDKCKNIVDLGVHIASAHKLCASLASSAQSSEYINSAERILRAIKTRIQNKHTNISNNELNAELLPNMEKLEKEIDHLKNYLK